MKQCKVILFSKLESGKLHKDPQYIWTQESLQERIDQLGDNLIIVMFPEDDQKVSILKKSI